MQLKPGFGASYAIRPENGVGLFYSSPTHTGPSTYVIHVYVKRHFNIFY